MFYLLSHSRSCVQLSFSFSSVASENEFAPLGCSASVIKMIGDHTESLAISITAPRPCSSQI